MLVPDSPPRPPVPLWWRMEGVKSILLRCLWEFVDLVLFAIGAIRLALSAIPVLIFIVLFGGWFCLVFMVINAVLTEVGRILSP